VTAVLGRRGSRGDLADVMVVFDWNGTVMADVERAVAATNAVLAAHGIAPLDEAGFRESFRLPLAGWLGGLGVPEGEAAWNAAMAARPALARPEAAAALAALHEAGALVAVVSAAGAEAVGADLAATGLAPYVGTVWTAVSDKASRLAEDRGLRPRAIYVGDTEYDVRAARRAGYEAVALTGGYRPAAALAEVGPAAVLHDLHQVVEFAAG
jgi:phosphoglycolate phosphatase